MKVEFLNEKRDRVMVTKGFLWWKRSAILKDKYGDGSKHWWVFEINRGDPPNNVQEAIRQKLVWEPVAKLPEARIASR